MAHISVVKFRDICKELADGGKSHKQIARKYEVSIGTVQDIARGKHHLQENDGEAHDADEVGHSFPTVEVFVKQGRETGRCPSCGGIVQFPCHKCWVDSLQKKRGCNNCARSLPGWETHKSKFCNNHCRREYIRRQKKEMNQEPIT